ncbi:YfbM family protein [Plantactinospora sonchi]|uniref:YfbM family protein n=1 Tax=Plantactinospora sonchi TaxID=1544735 RepID=A0ABU7RNA5_9ACTN
MSMITNYLRLRPHELAELRRLLDGDPDDAAEYAADLRMGDLDEEVSSRGMDTDKAWAGLQYLLAKLSPPVDVISGGEPMTDDRWGYDSPRLLSTDAVADAALFLEATSFASLAEHYDPTEMISAKVYPVIWDQDWALSYLEDYYSGLVALFRVAAADREPILVWMG